MTATGSERCTATPWVLPFLSAGPQGFHGPTALFGPCSHLKTEEPHHGGDLDGASELPPAVPGCQQSVLRTVRHHFPVVLQPQDGHRRVPAGIARMHGNHQIGYMSHILFATCRRPRTGIMTTRQRWTMVAVILGSAIVFLDSSVVNLALPQIGEELPSSLFARLEAQSYVANGYFVTLSALLVLAGALADFYGRRQMYAIGLVGFGVTSLLCGLAPNMEQLILFRILQGDAGALVVPASLSIITASFDGEEQGRAFGIWAGSSAATSILGPLVGGI